MVQGSIAQCTSLDIKGEQNSTVHCTGQGLEGDDSVLYCTGAGQGLEGDGLGFYDIHCTVRV
jgi:hypothetical protein